MSRMRSHVAIGPAVMSVLATVALVVALLTVPAHTGLIVRVYVLVLGLHGVWLILGVLAASLPIGRDLSIEHALRRQEVESTKPRQLEETEWQVEFAQHSPFDYTHRLRPVLLELATQRLASSAHIDPVSNPRAARERLGDEFWQATFGGAPSEDRETPGPKPAELRRLIEVLESL